MALADIITRIEGDTDRESDVVLKHAEERAAAIIEAAESKAASTAADALVAARKAAAAEAATIVAGARLAARDKAVRARRTVVEGVLAQVVELIEALPPGDYSAFLGGHIARGVRGGDTVAFAPADATHAAEVGRIVGERAPGAEIQWSDESAPVARGAVIEGTKTRLTVTPSAVVHEQRDRLEPDIAAALFSREGA